MWKGLLLSTLSSILLFTSCVIETKVSTTQEVPSTLDDILPPRVVAEIQNQVSQKLEVALQQVQIKSVERREWLDACLGLPEVDEVCAQTITPGWLVTVEIAGNAYGFRVDEEGTTIRQEP